MKQIAIMILLAISVSYAYSQTPQQQQNLEKYWRYRDRLREKFIVVSPNVMEEGVNIPCGYLFANGRAKFDDGNYNMSHYLSLLSTELYLLKKNGQDYSETLKELFYAMMALERLDLYSEHYWRDANGVNKALNFVMPSDINGMHLRDDITPAFWEKYKSHFGVGNYLARYNNSEGNSGQALEEISQDVMYHNIEGLSLVAKLVGAENIANVPVTYDATRCVPEYLKKKGIMNQDETVVDFSKWAKDFVRRYIAWFQKGDGKVDLKVKKVENNWILTNSVTGKEVQQGAGNDGFPDAWGWYNYGLIAVGKELLGGNGGREKDGFTASKKLFMQILDYGYNKSFYAVFYAALTPIFDLVTAAGVAALLDNLIIKGSKKDDYKVRSLACTGNVLGDDTYDKLKSRRSFDPLESGQKTIYEHFPLMNLALYDLDCKNMKYGNDYKSEKEIYEALLNSAPDCGPNSPGNTFSLIEYSNEWSTASRCIWPEDLGTEAKGEFCGMDYMMLYNLYCIAFSREQYATTKDLKSDINVVLADKITSKVTKKAPCITLAPNFEVSASANCSFTAEASSLPKDFVDGTIYKKIDYPYCDCRRTIILMAKPKIENDTVLVEDKPVELSAEEPLDISEFGEPCSNEQGIMVTPNPATNVMEVCVGNGFAMPIRVEAISLAGVLVDAVESNEPCCQFNVSQCPEGMYVVRVISGDKVSSVNVMVKH